MRDEKRIDRILKKIGLIWKRYPDMRLFQLLFNYTRLGTRLRKGGIADPFHYEDEDIEADVDAFIKEVIKDEGKNRKS